MSVNRQEHAVVGAGQVRVWLSVSKKCSYVRELLERDGGHRVLLIVGLSGIGRSCLARKIACDPPDEAIYEIAEAEKVEISKDVIKEISKEILFYHSRLGVGELPIVEEVAAWLISIVDTFSSSARLTRFSPEHHIEDAMSVVKF
ncbi:uncharacterized protein C2845_PM13G09620 [Panicum miliaceum]|uniref:NB-ARC domain-containing protein n=1 Tax=Panicum miliaceum TaxID=4540 RepID=A0A3L6RJJ1_PANMI|nr:uncharacterized protein C2845_PM13G09620 [Panicum miliaceum]